MRRELRQFVIHAGRPIKFEATPTSAAVGSSIAIALGFAAERISNIVKDAYAEELKDYVGDVAAVANIQVRALRVLVWLCL